MKSFRVSKIKNVDWGMTRALVNIAILDAVGGDVVVIRDCKLIQGDFGSFVASPSAKIDKPYENKSTGKMVEYTDFVYFDKKHRDILNELVANEYDVTMDEMVWYGADAGGNTDTVTEATIDDLITNGIPS